MIQQKEQKPASVPPERDSGEVKPAFVPPKAELRRGKENIWNLPNFLTFSRIISTFLIAFFIFADFHIFYIIAIFIIAMFTDVLDGFAARKLKLESKFGAKFDMAADRFFYARLLFIYSDKIKFSWTFT